MALPCLRARAGAVARARTAGAQGEERGSPSPLELAIGFVTSCRVFRHGEQPHPPWHLGQARVRRQALGEDDDALGRWVQDTAYAVSRKREALQLIAFKLEQLRFHLATSRRRLRDLRTLRGILRGESSAAARPAATAA